MNLLEQEGSTTETATTGTEEPILTTATSVYKTVEDLKDGVSIKDAYIADLKAALAAKEEAMGALQNTLNFKKEAEKEMNTEETKVAGTATTDSAAQLDKELFRKTVAELLQEQQVANTKAGNLQKAYVTIEKTFGKKPEDVLTSKATELGMSLDGLKTLAQEAPTAFMHLVGLEVKENKSLPKTFGSEKLSGVVAGEVNTNVDRLIDKATLAQPHLTREHLKELDDNYFKKLDEGSVLNYSAKPWNLTKEV